MKPADVAIWERFIAKFPEEYDSVDYDVKVGMGPAFDTVVNKPTNGDAIDLYKKKIDVVGYKGQSVHIIEVKPLAGSSALGQAKSYELLYRRDVDQVSPLKTRLITDTIRTDMPFLQDWMEVEVISV